MTSTADCKQVIDDSNDSTLNAIERKKLVLECSGPKMGTVWEAELVLYRVGGDGLVKSVIFVLTYTTNARKRCYKVQYLQSATV